MIYSHINKSNSSIYSSILNESDDISIYRVSLILKKHNKKTHASLKLKLQLKTQRKPI